jgi:hypothetical protein
VKLGGVAGAVGEMQLSGIENRQEKNSDHQNGQENDAKEITEEISDKKRSGDLSSDNQNEQEKMEKFYGVRLSLCFSGRKATGYHGKNPN